jgi:hypothetical protein
VLAMVNAGCPPRVCRNLSAKNSRLQRAIRCAGNAGWHGALG